MGKSLAELTSTERKGKDACGAFVEVCRVKAEALNILAEEGVNSLIILNRDFMRMCRKGGDHYSNSELTFYKGEIATLDTKLSEKKRERLTVLREKESELPAAQQGPLDKFLGAYADAVEKLCAEQGLGRKYGGPRRTAQEQVEFF